MQHNYGVAELEKRIYATRMVKRQSKQKQQKWFKAVRGSYIPNSTAGWLTYIPYLAYLIFAIYVGTAQTSSYALAILFIVPNLVAAFAVMTYIAARKS